MTDNNPTDPNFCSGLPLGARNRLLLRVLEAQAIRRDLAVNLGVAQPPTTTPNQCTTHTKVTHTMISHTDRRVESIDFLGPSQRPLAVLWSRGSKPTQEPLIVGNFKQLVKVVELVIVC